MGDRYDQSVISAVENGRSSLRMSGLIAAARALGVSSDYLLGLADDPTPAAQLVPALAAGRRDAGLVPLRDVRAAAGWAADVESESTIGHVAFPRHWMRRHGLQPERCSVIEVVGDSMEPVLEDGCWILIDHVRGALLAGRVFAVWTGEGLVVKRAEREGGRWVLASESPRYGPLPLPRESRVVGEVRWAVRPV